MDKDQVCRFKIAQLWHSVHQVSHASQNSYSHTCIIQEILKDDDLDINYKVTINSEVLGSKTHLEDCTALHFTYYKVYDISTFTALLERGADYTIKNADNQTAFHLIISNCSNYYVRTVMSFMNAVLSAHVKSSNSTNPRDDNGISHLHGACIANNVEAVELFLGNGTSVDEAVNFDAPQYAGHTPLHFAAAFHSFEVVKVLVERGANVNAQTPKGTRPLDLLITGQRLERSVSQADTWEKEQILKLLLDKGAVSGVGLSSLQVAFTFKDLKVAEQLLNQGADIDYTMPMDSALYPGKTVLQFAADNSVEAVKMLLKRGAKMELANAKKSTPFAVCMRRYSLQDMCDILSCIEVCKKIRLSDGKTRLLDLMASMENLDKFKLFLQNEIQDINVIVPNDVALWPGHTILHLAVSLSKPVEHNNGNRFQLQNEKAIVKECLNRGLSMKVQNVRGQTPVHLAFIQGKADIALLFLQRLNELDEVANIVDMDNLSYLHIACQMKNDALLDKLLNVSSPEDLRRGTTAPLGFMKAGSTPLHVAVMSNASTIAEKLLTHGADLHATDANGMTPIHWLLEQVLYGEHQTVNVLLASLLTNVEDRVVESLGLSYLHVACLFDNVEIIENLLDRGCDVNAVIKSEEDSDSLVTKIAVSYLRIYTNDSPLRVAIKRLPPNDNVLNVLLRRGADIFVKGSKNEFSKHFCTTPLENYHVLRCFFQVLLDREDMRKSMEERLGLTKLHIACFLKNEEAVKSALDDGLDVKAQLSADSEIFAGCTPLHLLLSRVDSEEMFPLHFAQFTVGGSLKMLLDRGADVTALNFKLETPVHVFNIQKMNFFDGNICKNLLLNAHQNFGVNSVDREGISHFHLACLWHEAEVVEKFLQHGAVDVNQPLDYFAKRDYAGCTPLHLALSYVEPANEWTKLSQTVDVLLKHGADVAAKDVNGDTPLHKPVTLRSPNMSILDKLLSYGGDIEIRNVRGQTPIEQLIEIRGENINPSDNLAIFQKYGYNINSWNRLTGEGYIAKIFMLHNYGKLSESSEFAKFIESLDVKTVDSMGRTAIHNVVALSKETYNDDIKNYVYAIESFIKIGIDLEYQDESGQTALHYAAWMENSSGVKALLLFGADVNIVDKNGKSAFSHAMEHSGHRMNFSYSFQRSATVILRLHVQKLQHLRIEVNQLNLDLLQKLQKFFEDPIFQYHREDSHNLSQKFFSQIELTKTLNVKTNSLTLFDFLSETGAVNLYPLLRKSERDIVDQFFKSIDFQELEELKGIIKLQFKKMTERLELIDSALNSLRTLLGFSIPNLCEEISRFLLNSDLKNLIESTAL